MNSVQFAQRVGTRGSWRAALQILVAAAALGAACHKSNASSGSVVTDYVSGVDSAAGSAGTLDAGSPPAPSGGPSGTPSGGGEGVAGGSSGIGMQAGTPFGAADVSAGSPTGGSPPPDSVADSTGPTAAVAIPEVVTGFWKVTFPAPATQQHMLVHFAKNLPFSNFELRIQLVNVDGQVGPAATVPISLHTTTTTTVSITASWDVDSDLNLHVVEPNQNEIFAAAPTSSSGGRLDRDSMSNCVADNIRTENVTWPVAPAPTGAYTVRLDQFASCSTQVTNYVVIVNNGGVSSLVTGSFNAPGDNGGVGSGRLIRQFVHQAAGSIPSVATLSRFLGLSASPAGRTSGR